MLEHKENQDHQFTQSLGGYSYCFNIQHTDDIEAAIEIILSEMFEDLYEMIEHDGIFAVGWLCKRYTGTGTYQ